MFRVGGFAQKSEFFKVGDSKRTALEIAESNSHLDSRGIEGQWVDRLE